MSHVIQGSTGHISGPAPSCPGGRPCWLVWSDRLMRTLANPAKLGRTKQLCSSIQSAGSLVLLWELVPLGPLLGQLPGPGLAWLGLSQWPSLHLWNWLLPQALAWWLLQALAWQLWPGSFCSWLWPGSFCSWPWPGSWWLWPDWLWPDRLWPAGYHRLGTGHQLRLWSGHQWSQSPSLGGPGLGTGYLLPIGP